VAVLGVRRKPLRPAEDSEPTSEWGQEQFEDVVDGEHADRVFLVVEGWEDIRS